MATIKSLKDDKGFKSSGLKITKVGTREHLTAPVLGILVSFFEGIDSGDEPVYEYTCDCGRKYSFQEPCNLPQATLSCETCKKPVIEIK